MRPERILVEGFGTFRDTVEIDFDGVDLFALTGPTGSGKSTVIDAIVFALYGVIPRLDDKKLVGPVISQDRVEAKVQLDFSVGGARYTAVRVVRETVSKAKRDVTTVGLRLGSTKEARLERRVSAGEVEVLAGTADELTAEVEKLLGLSFEHFTTCVVLPQGQFARFLHHKPRHRQDLLVELLDLGVYAEMATLARGREKAAQGQVEWLVKERDSLAFATVEAAEQCRERVAALEGLLATLDEVQPRIDEVGLAVRDRQQQRRDAAECVELLASITVPAGVDELAADAAEATAALAAATEAARVASEAAASADEQREALGERTVLEVARRDHDERAELEQRVAKGESVVADADDNRLAARATAEAATAAHEQAVAALEQARIANRAAELAGHLVEGEPCPVCGNEVHEVPAHDAPALTSAEQAEVEARRANEAATEQLAHATATHTRASDLLGERRQQLAEKDERLAGAPTPDDIDRRLAAIDAAEAVVKAAKADERSARHALAAAEKRQHQLDKRAADAWSAFDAARDRVALLRPPPPDRADLRAAWQPLVDWAVAEGRRYEAEGATIAAEIVALQREQAELVESVIAACRAVDLDPAGRPPRDVTVEALADAKADVDSIDAALARVVELDQQTSELGTQQQIAGLLAKHLSANGFEKWVLDEALERLVLGATGILHELSGGAYSLVLDSKTSNFFVKDHKNADALRSARTLSGGETFLASLALALALADQVAEMAAGGAVRLESIFLDEGFGTLDPDTLDTVATAIEELGSRGRMVGLVSHVRELAERMPVRFLVTKGPATSTVERVDL